MATKKNPLTAMIVGSLFAAHTVGVTRFKFDLAAAYASGAATDETLIEIGIVPADCVMVRHLSRLEVPQLDSHVSPTGDFETGTATDPDALTSSAAAETAVVFSGEDFRTDTATGVIGSKTADTPIYMRISNVIATLGTGVIYFDLAFRPWNDATDVAA